MNMNESIIIDILLVEDNPQDMELTLRALKKINIVNRIHTISDGAEALDFLFCKGTYSDRNMFQNPKIVILDLKLPKVDGIEILRQMKNNENTKVIPVVVLTSSKEDKDIVESYKLGVNSYIVKPVRLEKFFEAVKEIGLYWLLINQNVT